MLTFFTVSYASAQNGANDDLRAGAYKDAVDEATARTAANDAKALESKRLIARASGPTVDDAWKAASAIVDDNTSFSSEWEVYKEAHAKVDELDVEGDWDGAVTQATSTLSGGSTFSFDAFDAASADAIEQSGHHRHRRAQLQRRRPDPFCGHAAGWPARGGGRRLGYQPATEGVLVKRLAVVALILLVSACGYDATEIPEPEARAACNNRTRRSAGHLWRRHALVRPGWQR